MRRTIINIDEVKQKILSLKGSTVEMNVNRGRKKFDTINGVIQDVYPSVFTVILNENNEQQIQTFSYFDVLCGNIIIM